MIENVSVLRLISICISCFALGLSVCNIIWMARMHRMDRNNYKRKKHG